MTIKQLSIFIENKGGTLINVLELLSQSHVQIIASTIADTKDYGIYRILCNEPARAYIILKEAGINVQLSDVFAITIDDEPGRAAQAIKALSDENVSILYLYSFLWKGKGVLAFRTDAPEKAKEIIMLKKLSFLTEEDFK
ncbi:MAG: amino acid-binding protein [Bacteroidales bacterium]|nr:amino acid-binding protein [Bacteroidales bacterium]